MQEKCGKFFVFFMVTRNNALKMKPYNIISYIAPKY